MHQNAQECNKMRLLKNVPKNVKKHPFSPRTSALPCRARAQQLRFSAEREGAGRASVLPRAEAAAVLAAEAEAQIRCLALSLAHTSASCGARCSPALAVE